MNRFKRLNLSDDESGEENSGVRLPDNNPNEQVEGEFRQLPDNGLPLATLPAFCKVVTMREPGCNHKIKLGAPTLPGQDKPWLCKYCERYYIANCDLPNVSPLLSSYECAAADGIRRCKSTARPGSYAWSS